jgi:uncharacterized OB-fold protein
MTETSVSPDISKLEIPADAWTRPFWIATRDHRLTFPRCTACTRFRWPPGPFCPVCHAQEVDWAAAGQGRIFSFTIISAKPARDNVPPDTLVPALIEFPEAGGVRLLGALVDAPIDRIAIGMAVAPAWVEASNATVPMFRLI